MKRIFIVIIMLLICDCAFSQHRIDVLLLSNVPKSAPCGILYNVAKINVKVVCSADKKITKGDTVSFYLQCPGDFPSDFWRVGEKYKLKYRISYTLNNANFINNHSSEYFIVGLVIDAKKGNK